MLLGPRRLPCGRRAPRRLGGRARPLTPLSPVADGRVLTCAAVWRMPEESEPGSHESPDESSSAAHALELLCDLDGAAAHGSAAW